MTLSPHFKSAEFACNCGCGYGMGLDDISPALVDVLEILREALGHHSIRINSGCRCAEHNRRVGGVRNSQHLRGTAADIVVRGILPAEVAEMARSIVAIGGVGEYDSFVHIDVRGHRAEWRG